MTTDSTVGVSLNEKELQLLTDAIHRIQIHGIDAPFITGILTKLYAAKTNFDKKISTES